MQQKTRKWLSLVLAVLLVSACFTGTLLVRAAQDVAIDETHFPDAGFRQIVAEKCDKNGDGILSDSERSSITRMMLPAWQEDVLGEGTPIVSLEGIQYFYNLQNLYCADIGLTSLDVSALSKLTQLTGGAVHQGVAAEGACGTYVSLEELLERAAEKGEPPLLVLCDGIQDPHNLGAIIRTAEAAGAHGVIIPKRRSASLTLTVGKTSAGAASWLPVARVPNLASAMEILKKNNVWIYGTDAAGTSYTDADFTGGTAFVIGSEGFGMSRLVGEKCDAMLSLPMRGKVNSLNASVAAGIFLYEAVRQRLAK